MTSCFSSCPTLLAVCCSVTLMAQAAEPVQLDATDVHADAVKPSPGALSEAFAGLGHD